MTRRSLFKYLFAGIAMIASKGTEAACKPQTGAEAVDEQAEAVSGYYDYTHPVYYVTYDSLTGKVEFERQKPQHDSDRVGFSQESTPKPPIPPRHDNTTPPLYNATGNSDLGTSITIVPPDGYCVGYDRRGALHLSPANVMENPVLGGSGE